MLLLSKEFKEYIQRGELSREKIWMKNKILNLNKRTVSKNKSIQFKANN